MNYFRENLGKVTSNTEIGLLWSRERKISLLATLLATLAGEREVTGKESNRNSITTHLEQNYWRRKKERGRKDQDFFSNHQQRKSKSAHHIMRACARRKEGRLRSNCKTYIYVQKDWNNANGVQQCLRQSSQTQGIWTRRARRTRKTIEDKTLRFPYIRNHYHSSL